MTNLQRFIAVLVKHRRFIFWDVLLVTVLVAGYSLVAPKIYTSQAQILPPDLEESSISGLPSLPGAAGIGNVARLGGSLRGTQASDLVAAILGSRTVREQVIDSCDFMRVYRIRSGREEALKALKGLTKIGVTDEGIVTLAVEARTPTYAERLATCFVNAADRFLRESNMSRGRNMRVFIERRLVDAESELAAAEESLTSFQKANRITAVGEETKAAIESYAKLQAQKMALDVELELAERIAGSDNPYARALRQRSVEFERQLTRFEQGGEPRFGVGLGIPLKGVPDVAAEYTRRLSNYTLKQELRALLVQQHEQACITEARDTPTITLLDPPKVPERRSYPKRARMTLIALALSLAGGILISLLLESWDQQRRDERVWQGWQQLAHTLKLNQGVWRRLFFRGSDQKPQV